LQLGDVADFQHKSSIEELHLNLPHKFCPCKPLVGALAPAYLEITGQATGSMIACRTTIPSFVMLKTVKS
jgi:hypothetical protein